MAAPKWISLRQAWLPNWGPHSISSISPPISKLGELSGDAVVIDVVSRQLKPR